VLENLVKESQALDRAIAGEELSFDDGMELMNYENMHMLGAVANNARQNLVGDTVSFTASYYMNYTNICAASCQMCAFYRKGDEDDAYTLTPEQIEQRVATAKKDGCNRSSYSWWISPKSSFRLLRKHDEDYKKESPRA